MKARAKLKQYPDISRCWTYYVVKISGLTIKTEIFRLYTLTIHDLRTELTKHEDADEDCKEHQEDAES